MCASRLQRLEGRARGWFIFTDPGHPLAHPLPFLSSGTATCQVPFWGRGHNGGQNRPGPCARGTYVLEAEMSNKQEENQDNSQERGGCYEECKMGAVSAGT